MQQEINAGAMPIFLLGWYGDPKDFGYPSFPLGIAHAHVTFDHDISALVAKGDGGAVEQALLDKAWIVPTIFVSRP